MKKFYITILSIVLLSIASQAQPIVKGIVFTTGGSFATAGNHIKLYKFDYVDFGTNIFDSILGDYSNHVVVESHFAYVHVGRASGHVLGADRIYRYDLLDQAAGPIDSTDEISGIQKFEIYDNRLVIARGYPATSDFVEVVDKDDLSTSLYSDNTITGSCDGVVIDNQKAYISATNYGVGGVIHVIDLGSTIANEGAIQLDTLSLGAKEIYADNGMIYMTNVRYTPSYTVWYAGVTSVDLSDSSFVTDTTGLADAKGFMYSNNTILGDFGNPIENYNVSTGVVSQLFAHNPTAVLGDPNGTGFAVQSTDYFSYGKVEFMDNMGNVGLTVNTDISGSAMAGVANNVPVGVNDTVLHALSSLPNLSPFLIDVLANDFDIDSDSLTIHSVSSSNATIVDNEIEYDPSGNGASPDTLVYIVKDPWGDYDSATVYIDFTVGISEISNNNSAIFPNPANDVIQITTELGTITNVNIIDATGRYVNSKTFNNSHVSVDVSTLKNGMYFVAVEANGAVEIHRIIVK